MQPNTPQGPADENRSGVLLMAAGQHEEALKKFAVAFQTIESARNELNTALLEASMYPQSTHRTEGHTALKNQKIFPVPHSVMSCSYDECEGYYVYRKGLAFHSNAIPDGVAPISYRHSYQPTYNLLLSACTFNMALSFHQSSRNFVESIKLSALRVALNVYNTVIESVGDGWDTLDVHGDVDAACMLAAALNNKAIICFEMEQYETCEAARAWLVLLLNTFISDTSRSAFLTNQDIVNFYRNGLLMVTPSLARAA